MLSLRRAAVGIAEPAAFVIAQGRVYMVLCCLVVLWSVGTVMQTCSWRRMSYQL